MIFSKWPTWCASFAFVHFYGFAGEKKWAQSARHVCTSALEVLECSVPVMRVHFLNRSREEIKSNSLEAFRCRGSNGSGAFYDLKKKRKPNYTPTFNSIICHHFQLIRLENLWAHFYVHTTLSTSFANWISVEIPSKKCEICEMNKTFFSTASLCMTVLQRRT